ncbi:DUF1643 domain-containing protein [Lacticaseibacillus manihotivorans]|jgi:hypothetical protein|uniref:DUF1643 domain-containing protein n=2 Tax=Lacticaseibacillus manihotivorans TaxID=88233 RepID=A0A0R1QFX3_9LACO|nr:DUF1643 domain-containing protein [Lacticaseibacillus manihotivorans]KRL43728.1 hypothetical protein FD01_GL001571 [Lacticaseibacillus manihotivorans DSM 13343 = JCM 12514]QFQ90058.1 DUF1643 domain-containing protein [Lacticaseibacillus manihotivorans]
MANQSHKYPDGFSVNEVVKKNGARYSLVLNTPTPDAKLTLFVLMMNPSSADGEDSDPTVNKLLRTLGASGKYKKVVIVNTTPIIETDSDNLKNRQAEINKLAMVNASTVAKQVKLAGHFHFLVATGLIKKGVNDKSYVALMDQIDQQTTGDGLYVVDLTKDDYGKHPLYTKDDDVRNLKWVSKADAQWHLKLHA